MIPVEIPPNTVMLKGIGYDSNIYLFRDGKEGLIIDTGTGIYWHRYFEVLERENYLDGLEKVIILNTHEHFDHIGGNRKFKEVLEKRGIDVKFAAHRFAADVIERGDDYVILSYAYGKRFMPHSVDVRLDDGDILEVGGKKLEVIHTPGHTAGSSCLYEPEEKILFTGDTLFKGAVGRTDLPTGSFEKLIESLERLSSLDVYIALPGHGKPVTNWKENFEHIKKILGEF
ncbi:MBL fold metallo-hydrolase [Thermococcus aggregans]|uniref:MBL fold metallo-hydrolase n=1 Tax=Thermococcus aggregans TaxID=110163 RepID=A0A9E7MYQ7_THEAG|nr:MBL fold metallo-hydrolase [Thermococcus aggregans]USS41461.1 MBL fold metallo-hydrolase [Thermococcus aggregans]